MEPDGRHQGRRLNNQLRDRLRNIEPRLRVILLKRKLLQPLLLVWLDVSAPEPLPVYIARLFLLPASGLGLSQLPLRLAVPDGRSSCSCALVQTALDSFEPVRRLLKFVLLLKLLQLLHLLLNDCYTVGITHCSQDSLIRVQSRILVRLVLIKHQLVLFDADLSFGALWLLGQNFLGRLGNVAGD